MSDAPGATRTVQRALRLLGAVTENGGTLSDLARMVELSPSTTSRLLSTLTISEFVRRGDLGAGGYAMRSGAVEPDVTSIAAPVRGPDGAIAAALSVLAPSYRTSQRRVRSIGEAVAAHAGALSQSLGAPPTERVA
jgi:DNA-binding IclR family transcriptional regulator